MDNRRNPHPRYEVSQPVSLLIGNKGYHISCELKDMSLSGAKLASIPLRYLPERFKILITGENVELPCRLRWIEGRVAGVQFTGDPVYDTNTCDEQQTTLSADYEPKYEVSKPVNLLIGNNGYRVPCELKDMSLTGARLTSVPQRYIPQTFKILITNENVELPCRLRWIESGELGVQFTGDPVYGTNTCDEQQTTLSAGDEPK